MAPHSSPSDNTPPAAEPQHYLSKDAPPPPGWRRSLYLIIFEANSRAGKAFDLALLLVIIASVAAVMLETVPSITDPQRTLLRHAEWVFTALFTIEYILRLACVRSPARYARSFFGIIDLLAILPTFISLLLPGTQSLIVIRAFRLIRVFRVLKLARYVGESEVLLSALRASKPKIIVFLVTVIALVLIIGSLMYLIESPNPDSGFTSIPQAVYWAIVTMTTVGYGDISPTSVPGKALASLVMILGYGIIAVPTGIVTAELTRSSPPARPNGRHCPDCHTTHHQPDAIYCRRCSAPLPAPLPPHHHPPSTSATPKHFP